jgi:hypothetical protein
MIGTKVILSDETRVDDFEIHLNSLRYLQMHFKGYIMTAPVTAMDEIILISRSAPYTQFDKIFMPFEIEVWHWLIGTLTFFVVAICILKLTPKFVQEFVFGSRVWTPLLNCKNCKQNLKIH